MFQYWIKTFTMNALILYFHCQKSLTVTINELNVTQCTHNQKRVWRSGRVSECKPVDRRRFAPRWC